jgi:hypothetical protein
VRPAPRLVQGESSQDQVACHAPRVGTTCILLVASSAVYDVLAFFLTTYLFVVFIYLPFLFNDTASISGYIVSILSFLCLPYLEFLTLLYSFFSLVFLSLISCFSFLPIFMYLLFFFLPYTSFILICAKNNFF